MHFDVHTDDASLARLNRLVNPAFRNQPWYHLLRPWQRHEDALLKLRASGTLYPSYDWSWERPSAITSTDR